MKFFKLGFFSALLIGLISFNLQTVKAATPTLNQGIVSLTFDDNKGTQYTNAYPTLNNNGFNGTFYIVTSWINGTGLMTKAQIQQLVTSGNELGSHTVNHLHLNTLNNSDLTYELSQSQVTLQQQYGVTATDFSAPFGEANSTVTTKIKSFYGSNRSVNQGFNTKGSINAYNILVKSVYSTTSVATVKSWIDQAYQNKTWLVLVYHSIVAGGDSDSTTPANFNSEVAYLKQTGVSVQTIKSALTEVLNQNITPTPMLTPTPNPSPIPTVTPTLMPTPTPTTLPTPMPTAKPTPIPTVIPTPTLIPSGNRGIVSITFNDDKGSQYTNAYPTLVNNGLNGTFYIVSDWINGTGLLTSAQISQMTASGNELASKTVNNLHLTTLNDADLTYEVSQSQLNLQQKFGVPVTDFVSPFGETNPAVINKIKQYYASNRSINQGFNVKGSIDPYNILTKSVYNATPMTTVQSWIDQAVLNKTWLVLVYNDVVNGGDSDSTTPANFNSEMSYLKQTGISVQTVKSALAEMTIGQTPTPTPTPIPSSTGAVSLTFDDGKISNFINAYPIMKANGLTGTFYIVSSWIGGSGLMTSSQINQLISTGNEIGSHTVNHPHLPTLSDADLTYELSQSQQTLQQQFGIQVTDFASPFGEFNDTVVNKIRIYYASNRSINQGFNVKGSINPYNLLTKSVYNTTTPATVELWIDQAIQNKYWLILVYHDVVDVGDSDSTTLSDFTTEMNYLRQTGVKVQNMKTALFQMMN